MTHTYVRPTRLRIAAVDPMPTVLRTFGYAAECRCGWKGPIRRARPTAVEDMRRHKGEHAA